MKGLDGRIFSVGYSVTEGGCVIGGFVEGRVVGGRIAGCSEDELWEAVLGEV